MTTLRSYAFDQEAVHFARNPIEGDSLPTHVCRRCERRVPQEQFGPVASSLRVGSRVNKFKSVQALHPYCFRCRKQARGAHVKHPLYKPALDAAFSIVTRNAKGGAASRGILFALDKDDILGLFLAQQGICALTGIEMDWKATGHTTRHGRNYKGPSIDRIDSSGNYVLGNVHVVTQVANIMKNDLPIDVFVALCEKIVSHNIGKF